MISQLMTEYLQDSEFAEHFQSPEAPYTLRDGRLYRDGRFSVLNGSLPGLVQHHHDAVTAGHRGATKTLKTSQNKYYWDSLAKDVRDYVRTCDACQRAKSDRRRHAGLFTPHVPPMTKWSEVSINFKFEILETDAGSTGLAVVADKLSKQAHFLPFQTEIFSSRLGLCLHSRGLSSPWSTIKDHPRQRRKIYVQVLVNVTQFLGTKLNISTAFHPETDG
jgi:Integrase zinc binding domain